MVEANLTPQDWKGHLNWNLSGIKKGDELFQEFLDRLLVKFLETEIGSSYNQCLAMAATLQGTTVQAMLSQCQGDKGCFKYGGRNHFRRDCPKKN